MHRRFWLLFGAFRAVRRVQSRGGSERYATQGSSLGLHSVNSRHIVLLGVVEVGFTCSEVLHVCVRSVCAARTTLDN